MTDQLETPIDLITEMLTQLTLPIENLEETIVSNEEEIDDSADSGPEDPPNPDLFISIPTVAVEFSPDSPTYSPFSPPLTPSTEDAVEEAEDEESDEREEKVESKQEEEKGPTNDEEVPSCGVCYIEFTSDNIVNTSCSHKFCNKCFFKWLKVQARCPMCRKHFRTDVDLSDEELARENSENYQEYIYTLERYVSTKQMVDFWSEKVNNLRNQRDQFMRCQISLKNQIEETRAFNDGLVAAGYKNIGEEIPRDIYMKYEINKRVPYYLYGWRKGLRIERERLEKETIMKRIRNKCYNLPNRNKKSKKRQADLFSFGFNSENKVLKTSGSQKEHEAIEFSFDFVPRDPHSPLPLFQFKE
jgi:hypothetical protein